MNHVSGSTNQQVLEQVVDERQVEPGHDAAGEGAREHRRDDGGGHAVARAHAAGEILGQADQHHRHRRQRQRQLREATWPRPYARTTASVAAQAMTTTMPPSREVGTPCSFCTPWGSSWPNAARVNRQRHQDAGAGCGNDEGPPIDQFRAVRRSGRILPGEAPVWHTAARREYRSIVVRKCPHLGAMRSRKNPAANPAHSPRSPHMWRSVADNRRPDEPVDCGSAVRPMVRRCFHRSECPSASMSPSRWHPPRHLQRWLTQWRHSVIVRYIHRIYSRNCHDRPRSGNGVTARPLDSSRRAGRGANRVRP